MVDVQGSAGAGPDPDTLYECSLPRFPPRDPVSQFMEQSAIDDAICRLIFTDLLREHGE